MSHREIFVSKIRFIPISCASGYIPPGRNIKVGRHASINRKLKQTRVGQIILSGILPVMRGRGQTYRNCKRMAINAQVEQMCEEEMV
ncbi:MAG: hypothetical protein M3H12_10985, partial [Chromatiales bacterium]